MKRINLILLKILWSGIGIVDGRGKLGGTVMTKSKQGATARVKVTPVNRRSTAQSLIRGIFTGFSQRFRTLTATQIAAWNALGTSGFKTHNIFGNAVGKSGINLYVKMNSTLVIIDQAPIDNAPSATDSPTALLTLETTCVAGTSLLPKAGFFSGSSVVPANNSVLYTATPVLSPGVAFVKNQLRVIGVQGAATDTSTTSILGNYEAKFGTLTAGDEFVFSAQTVNNLSGAAGTPIQVRVTVS